MGEMASTGRLCHCRTSSITGAAHVRDQRERDFYPVEFVQLCAGRERVVMPRAYSASIFEGVAFQPCLAFFDQLRVKGALPVPRHVDFDLALFALHRFLAGAVAGVAGGMALAPMLGIAQMVIEFSLQTAFDHGDAAVA